MANSNGIISAPVSTTDICTVIGVSSHDVGTLCTSPNINPYSLIKPTYSTNPVLNKTGLPTHVPKTGYNMGYGYKIPYVDRPSVSASLDLSDNFGGRLWEHADVELNGTDYACMSLFEGYNHGAYVADRFRITGSGDFSAPNVNSDVYARFSFVKDSTAVSVNNILKGKKLGVWFKDIANNNFMLQTSTVTLTPQTENVVIVIPKQYVSVVGDYKFVPYVVDGNRYYTIGIDRDMAVEINIGDGGQGFVTSMTWRREIEYMVVYVTIGNATINPITVTKQTISYVCYNSANTVIKNGTVTIPDDTVPGKTNISAPGWGSKTVSARINLTGVRNIAKIVLTYSGTYGSKPYHLGRTIIVNDW